MVNTEINFLGQHLVMGSCAFFAHEVASVFSGGTAFDVPSYFRRTYGNFDASERIDSFFDSSGNCIFAMAYKKNPNNDHEINTYVFPVQQGNYPDPDSFTLPNAFYPNYASYGWVRLSNWDGYYSGFDPDNYTLEDMVHNQFSLYQYESTLCPFYYRYGGSYYDVSDLATEGISVILVLRIQNNDTGVYGFNEVSSIEPYIGGGGVGTINFATPSYSTPLDNQYYLSWIHIAGMCNVLNIDGVEGDLDNFTDDTSTTTGINGGYRPYDGSVWFHDLPGKSFADCGLITMFAPTVSQLQNLGSYLWTSDFITNVKKLIADPLDNIVSLGYVPIDVSSVKDAMTRELYVGNIGTGVQMYGLSTQYIKVDMGTVNVPERWSGALDYSPYSHCELYLPAVGFVQIPIDEIMGADVSIMYYVDLLSGDCVAEVGASRPGEYKNLIAIHKGNCKVNCALTGKNYGEYYANLMSSAPRALASFGTNMASGNMLGAGAGLVSDATAICANSPRVERSGAFTGAGSLLASYTPYILFTQPIQQLPPKYQQFIGFPSYITKQLGKLTGFTMVEQVIDNTVPATETEKRMIEDALKEGVILPPIES